MTNQLDVAPFIAVLLDPASATPDQRCAADVNASGTPDADDIRSFLALVLR